MSYKQGIIDAILELKDRTGSSSISIKKLMQSKLPADKKWMNATYLAALKHGVASGDFVQVKNSYKLSAPFKAKLSKPPKAKVVKKKAPAKKKAAAGTKKKTAPKKKAPVKKTTAAKKKTAAPKKKSAAPKKATTAKPKKVSEWIDPN